MVVLTGEVSFVADVANFGSIITVYGIVSGVTGGGLPISILLILGLATVFADAISMYG